MNVMDKWFKTSVELSIVILLVLSATAHISTADTQTLIRGHIFIDNRATRPDEVHLLLADDVIDALLYDDGRYLLVTNNTFSRSKGTFTVIYCNTSYMLSERVTLEEDILLYVIDLYVDTSVVRTKSLVSTPGGPYVESPGLPLQFNGTQSYDLKGVIISYEWTFGDSSFGRGPTPTHTYQREGNYTVTLTVTDNNGKSNQTSTYALITDTLNHPPTNPLFFEPAKGDDNKSYRFVVRSSDLDNDMIHYVLNWNDASGHTITDSVLPNTNVIVSHSWENPGQYTIEAIAIDGNSAPSGATQRTISVGMAYCQDIGFLVDHDFNGIFDGFYSNATHQETLPMYSNKTYLIDANADGLWDQSYNPTTSLVMQLQQRDSFTLFSPTPLLILAGVIGLICITVIAFLTKRRTVSNAKLFYMRKKNIDLSDIGNDHPFEEPKNADAGNETTAQDFLEEIQRHIEQDGKEK